MRLTFLILIILAYQPLIAELKSKVLPDGTIDFYTRDKTIVTMNKISFKTGYNQLIDSLAEEEGIDSYLVKCIIKIESDFNTNAISPAGAMGLMQLMQDTANIYNVKNPFDPDENVRAGIKHFKSLMKYFKNDIPLSLAAYHAGLGRVKKRMTIPPIKATINYVNAIMRLYSGQKSASYENSVKGLYKKIENDGTIIIYN